MEITEVKNILGITTTKHDTYLATVVPLFTEAAQDYCNNPFTDESGAEALPGGVKIAIAKWCQLNMNQSGLKSRSMGEVSYSYDLTIPDTIKGLLRPHRRLKFA